MGSRYAKTKRSIIRDQRYVALGDYAKLLFHTLLVHPSLTTLGAMCASIEQLARDLGWPCEKLQHALAELTAAGMVQTDEKAQLFWIRNFLKHNVPESPNVIKSWETALDYLPECPLRNTLLHHAQVFVKSTLSASFYAALPPVFLKAPATSPLRPASAAPQPNLSAPLPSGIECWEETEGAPAFSVGEQIYQKDVFYVFNYWKTTLDHPKALLNEERQRLISDALVSGYTVEQLCQAIKGCSLTPHNMGQNKQYKLYDGLHVILRDADQIDRFSHNALHPPRPPHKDEVLMQSNLAEGQNWLKSKEREKAGEAASEPDIFT